MAQTLMPFVHPATRQLQWSLRQAITEQLATPPKKIKQKEPKPEDFFSAFKQQIFSVWNSGQNRKAKIKKFRLILAQLIDEIKTKCFLITTSTTELQLIQDFFKYLGLSDKEINKKNGAEQLYIFLEKK